MSADSKLLRQNLHEVGSQEEEYESSQIEVQDLVGHFVGDLADGLVAVVVGAFVEHEVEESVEGERGQCLEPSGELGGHLVDSHAQGRADHHRPDGHDVADYIGRARFAEEGLEEGGHSYHGQGPADGHQNQQKQGGFEEEVSAEDEGTEEEEDEDGDEAEAEVENEVDQPVVANLHAVHFHHLHQFLLLLQDQAVEHHREEQAEGQGEEQGGCSVDDTVNERFGIFGGPCEYVAALEGDGVGCLLLTDQGGIGLSNQVLEVEEAVGGADVVAALLPQLEGSVLDPPALLEIGDPVVSVHGQVPQSVGLQTHV